MCGAGIAGSGNGFVMPECLDSDLLEEQSLDGETPNAAHSCVFAERGIVWGVSIRFEVERLEDYV